MNKVLTLVNSARKTVNLHHHQISEIKMNCAQQRLVIETTVFYTDEFDRRTGFNILRRRATGYSIVFDQPKIRYCE